MGHEMISWKCARVKLHVVVSELRGFIDLFIKVTLLSGLFFLSVTIVQCNTLLQYILFLSLSEAQQLTTNIMSPNYCSSSLILF